MIHPGTRVDARASTRCARSGAKIDDARVGIGLARTSHVTMTILRRSACLSLVTTLALACGGHANVTPKTPEAKQTQPAPPKAFSLTSADVDATLRAAWQAKGITPSARADDATYLRRVWLDVVGTIPPSDKVASFTADSSPDKRSKVVDELLASPAYADHWMIYWDDLLMGRARAGDLDRQAFRVWLHDQFEKNTPWDKVVYALITATGKNSTGGGYAKSLSETESQMQGDGKVDGAVNYVLRFRDTPQDMAGSVSKTFLGVQIQCAQCHDHKTEKWRQTDFQKFAACFARTQLVPLGDKGMKGIKTVEVRDLDRAAPRFNKNMDLEGVRSASPTALDGTAMDGNARHAIATWITKNPWFAEETTNRMWAHFLGRGFTNPVDDLRPSNPPDMPELQAKLAKDFAESGYDPKRLIKLITQTEAYQLSSSPPAGAGASEIPLWSQFHMVPLGPEELTGSLLAATGVEGALARLTRTDVDDLKLRLTQLFSFVFDVDEEFDQPRFEGTLTQALVLLNGKLTSGASAALPGTAVGMIAKSRAPLAQKIETIYLRTVSRKPTQAELDAALAYVASEPPPAVAPADPNGLDPAKNKGGKKKGDKKKGDKKGGGQDVLRPYNPEARTTDPETAALEDIMWALLNSSEFAINH